MRTERSTDATGGHTSITVAIGALVGYPVGLTMRMARLARTDSVELLLTPSILRRGPAHYRALARHYGLAIRSVHARLLFGDAALDEALASDCASLRFAAAIPECEVLVVHHPVVPANEQQGLAHWGSALAAEHLATQATFRIGVENRPENRDGTPRLWIDRPEHLLEFADAHGFGITYDLAHAASHGLQLVPTLETLLPHVVNVHWSDQRHTWIKGGIQSGFWRAHQLPGHGYLPLDDVAKTLRQADYAGLSTLELSPWSLQQWWPGLAARNMRTAVATLDDVLN